jgi:RNA polymerase sigma-70 factor, ECF subfamily
VGDLDADLVEAQRWSDADGPEQLLDRHGDRIYRLALRITGVEEDAAQAVEETILTATRTIHALGGKPALGSWVYQTAAKAAYQRLRARRPPVEEIALDDVLPRLDGDGRHFESMDDWSSRMPEGALQGALLGILTGAVDALPADYKTAFVLSDIEGASNSDIAEVLGFDVRGVNVRVNRARLFVRKRLSEYFESAAD